MSRLVHPFSRRSFLHTAAIAGIGAALPFGRQASLLAAPPTFEEIPPSRSGIAWVHNNGKSPEHWFKPDRCSGCAFLDYDNDGWMDIFLVNNGRVTLLPPVRRRRGKTPCIGITATGRLPTLPREPGSSTNRWGEGVSGRRLQRRRLPRPLPDLLRQERSCIATTGTVRSPTSRRRPGLQKAPGWSTSAVWFDYDNDGRLDLFVGAFVECYESPHAATCGDNQLGKRFYCIPEGLPRPQAVAAVSQQRRRHLRRGRRPRHRARLEGAWRGCHRRQPRRPRTSTSPTTRWRISSTSIAAAEGLKRSGYPRGWPTATTAGPRRDGRRCRQLRPGRQARSVRRQHRSRDCSLYRNDGNNSSPTPPT